VDGRDKNFGELQVTLDGMRAAIDLRHAIVKPTRAFAAVTHSENFARATEPSDQSAAQESLKIEGGIWMKLARLPRPREEAARCAQSTEFAARKNMDVVHIAVPAQQCCPFGINHPGDLRLWIRVADRRYRRQGVNNIAERARFDDEDRFQIADWLLVRH
jgi:hypothetical protein